MRVHEVHIIATCLQAAASQHDALSTPKGAMRRPEYAEGATSNEQRATSNEQRATSNEQRATQQVSASFLVSHTTSTCDHEQ
ncbi:MAG: hypothetical protein IPJ10_03065 [Flavobacteriales bacterium]|nr:hypothetical protein [Flavobacteriales bacterium]